MVTPDFDWSQLGDIQAGRPNLGGDTKVAVYRLMQYTLRSVLEKEFGEERMRLLLIQAGLKAGSEFCRNLLDTSLPLGAFMAQVQARLLELSIGVLKVEKVDTECMHFVVTVSEDLDCSGLPVGGNTVCDYDEGFIQGIFETYTGQAYEVKEVDCWSTGERTCRFNIHQLP